jgi:hypothetical protein
MRQQVVQTALIGAGNMPRWVRRTRGRPRARRSPAPGR